MASYLISGSGSEEGDLLTFTVLRHGDADPFDVYFHTGRLGDEASEGIDYTSADGTLLIFNEAGVATVQVQTTDDDLLETSESLTVFITAQPFAMPTDPGFASATVFIADNDEAQGGGKGADAFGQSVKDFVLTHNPHFASDLFEFAQDPTIYRSYSESNLTSTALTTTYLISGTGSDEGDLLTFTVLRHGDADAFDVYFHTGRLGDGASEGTDYTSADGTLLIFNEAGVATVQVQTTDDNLLETSESLTVFITAQPFAMPTDPGLASATVFIADNEEGPGGGVGADAFGQSVRDFVLTHNPHFAADLL